MTIFETLRYYFAFPFVRYALVVGVLIALCASLFGVTLVLKRFSFIGDGLSHVAFGALAVASVLDLTDEMLLVLPVTVAAAILLLRTGQNARLQGDAAIAVLSVGTLAVGYLLMNLFSTSTNLSGDVCSTLFGSTSILTLTKGEVWLCVVLSVVVIALFFLFYNRIFAVTFDEAFAAATGLPASRYNLLIAVVIAVIIVLAMNLVGSLLISALIIFPALAAMLHIAYGDPKRMLSFTLPPESLNTAACAATPSATARNEQKMILRTVRNARERLALRSRAIMMSSLSPEAIDATISLV